MESTNQHAVTTANKRKTWIRALYMVLMAIIFQVCGTLLFIVAVIQFVIALIDDAPNPRLLAFGRSLGAYLRQIVNYLTFASEQVPFPFSDWPEGD